MKKRIIEFVGWAEYLDRDSIPWSKRIEFDWDETTDIMIPARKALEKEMSKEKNLIDYEISYWGWVD